MKAKKIILGITGALLLTAAATAGVFAIKVNEFEKKIKSYEIKKADMVIDTYGSPDKPSLLLMHQ